MMATKIESKHEKFAKTKKVLKTIWKGTKTFLKISPLVAVPLFAQQKDSAKVADEAFFKPNLAAKVFVREFAGGKDVGAGAGVQAGAKSEWLSLKGSLSLAKDSSCIKGDGFNISASGTAWDVAATMYLDYDPLVRPTPVYGISASACGAGVKLERGMNWKFTAVGASYVHSSVSGGATAVFAEGKNGEAGVQKIVFKAGATCAISSNATANLEVSSIYSIPNASSTLGARLSINYTLIK